MAKQEPRPSCRPVEVVDVKALLNNPDSRVVVPSGGPTARYLKWQSVTKGLSRGIMPASCDAIGSILPAHGDTS